MESGLRQTLSDKSLFSCWKRLPTFIKKALCMAILDQTTSYVLRWMKMKSLLRLLISIWQYLTMTRIKRSSTFRTPSPSFPQKCCLIKISLPSRIYGPWESPFTNSFRIPYPMANRVTTLNSHKPYLTLKSPSLRIRLGGRFLPKPKIWFPKCLLMIFKGDPRPRNCLHTHFSKKMDKYLPWIRPVLRLFSLPSSQKPLRLKSRNNSR